MHGGYDDYPFIDQTWTRIESASSKL